MSRQIQPVHSQSQKISQLEAEFLRARQKLQETEKILAEEQAAVNAFRLYCRLTIGHWVDTLLELRSEKQSFLTKKRLLYQDLGLKEKRDAASSAPDQTASASNHSLHDGVDSLAATILEELIDAESQYQTEKNLYRDLARRFHPDFAATHVEKAYRTSIMAAINVAYQQKDLQTLRDLAGEIDPKVIAEIEAIDSDKIRQLRQKIVRCQRYERKVLQQLKALRQENTAKLWRKSKQIEQRESSDWWQAIKKTLEMDVIALKEELATLKKEVESLQIVETVNSAKP